MADLADLIQKLSYYQAGGKDQGQSSLDKVNQGFGLVNQTVANVLAAKKAQYEDEKAAQENTKLQGENTPFRDISLPLTPANSTIDENTTPEQKASMDKLYSQREAMGNTTLNQSKTQAEINSLGAGEKQKNAQTEKLTNAKNVWYNPATMEVQPAVAGQTPPTGFYERDLEKGMEALDKSNQAKQKAISSGQIPEDQIDATINLVKNGKIGISQLPGFGATSLKGRVIAKLATQDPTFSFMKNESDFQAVKDYTKYMNSGAYQNTIKYLESVQPNLNEVVNLSDKLDKTKYPIINQGMLKVMHETGDPTAAAFSIAVTETADQIAKILQGGGTGNATSDAKLNQAQTMLNGNFSPDQFKAVAGELKLLLGNRQQALENQTVKTLNLGNMPGNQAAPAPVRKPAFQPKTNSQYTPAQLKKMQELGIQP